MKTTKTQRIRSAAATWLTLATIAFAPCAGLPTLAQEARAQDVTAADVTLTDNGSTVTLDHGVVAANITKANAKVVSYIYNGYQMVDPGGQIYSMDGGSSYEQPSHCDYSVKINTPDLIDLSFKRVYRRGRWRVLAGGRFSHGRGDGGAGGRDLECAASGNEHRVGNWCA